MVYFEFSDITIRQAYGNYAKVCEIMLAEGAKTWMLRSAVTVTSDDMSSDWLLHFWDDGRVAIKDVSRPLLVQAPDSDVRGLSKYLEDQGWKKLEVDSLLLEETQHYGFWFRMYESSVIRSEVLQSHDESRRVRLAEGFEADQEVEDAD